MNNNIKPIPKKTLVGIYLFFLFLFALFAVNAVAYLPVEAPHDITKEGQQALFGDMGTYYQLDGDSYVLGSCYANYSVRSSSNSHITREYWAYVATVYPEGKEPFVMAIQVPEEKQAQIEAGENPDLYGMGALIPDDKISGWNLEVSGSTYAAVPFCLNDRNESILTRMLHSAVSAALSMLVIFLTVWVTKRQAKIRKMCKGDRLFEP